MYFVKSYFSVSQKFPIFTKSISRFLVVIIYHNIANIEGGENLLN